MPANRLAADLDHVLVHTADLWSELRGERIFITGGTGFFGTWLLESFAWANDRLQLDARAVVLSRNPVAFGQKAPHLAANPSISFLHGDVREFVFPAGSFSHIIHAATESSTSQSDDQLLQMVDTIIQGTRRTLDFGVAAGVSAFLLVSSGAVYGKQPTDISHVAEDYAGAPDPLDKRSAYAEGKRLAELLCAIYAHRYTLRPKIARCFAFIGPYLPLDVHFAAGNFIRDGLAGGPISVKGDGTPYRSYLYSADLMIWLWTILFRGATCRPYNVGSDKPVSIAELAQVVADAFHPPLQVTLGEVAAPGQQPQRYVPLTSRAQVELKLQPTINIREAIKRTVRWQTVGKSALVEG